MKTAGPATSAAVIALGALALVPEALGHETWAAVDLGKDRKARIAIETSAHYPVGQVAAKPDRLDSNMVMSGNALDEIKAWRPAGTALVSRTAPLQAGWHLFQFVFKSSRGAFKAAEFNQYLKEEGLEAAARERARRKEEDKPGRERYTKLGKALVKVGDPDADPPLAGAGLPYDLVPATDPTEWETGEQVEVKAIYRGDPALAKVVTLACARGGKVDRRSGTTDASGVAKLEVPHGDRCMLASIDMRRVEGDPDLDWESLWHTFTFRRASR